MDGLLSYFIFYIPIFAMLCISGIVLNGLMLVVFGLHSDTRTPQNILLRNLTASGFVYLLGGTVLILIVVLLHHETMCYITIAFVSFVMALNVCLVAALSLHRYISLKKFSNATVVDERECKYCAWIAFGMWMVAIALAGIEYVVLRPVAETCLETMLMGIPLYRLVLYAVLPIVIVKAFDRASSGLVATLDPPREVKDRHREVKKMQSRLALLCFLTYPPAIIISYLVATQMSEEYHIVVLPLGTLLTTLNAFFQPVVISMADRHLRFIFSTYLCCLCCYQEPDASQQLNPVVKTAIQQTGDQTSESVL